MAKKQKNSPIIEAKRLLGAGAPADVERLVALIHAVNPTDRGLSRSSAEERYALKSALQSHLIRHHPALVEVVPDAVRPDVVSLHLRGGPDAAHAVVSLLEPDARAWVWTELETGASNQASPSAPPQAEPRAVVSSPDPLAQGRLALDAYDYELARTFFEEAFARSHGGSDAALALLELLVDLLAAYGEALALEPRLSAPARRDPNICRCLALAAAHCGQEERAEALLAAVISPQQRAEVLAVLGRRADIRGDVAALTTVIQRLREADPAHPRLLPLQDRLAALRAAARQPAEQALEELVATGDWAAAEQCALDTLARWPGSTLARRVLAQVRQRQECQARADLQASVCSALDAGEPDLASRRLRAAPAEHREHPDLAALQVRVQEAWEGWERRQRLEQVVGLLEHDHRAGLLQWLDLPAALADEAASRCPSAVLSHLRRLQVDLPARRNEEAVDAVLAFEAAQAIALVRDPDAVLAALAPHQELLRRLPAARILEQEALALVRARQAGAAVQALECARKQLAAGDEAGAVETAEGALLPGLEAALRAQLEAVALEARQRQLERLRQDRWQALLAAGDLFAARDMAADLVPLGGCWPERLAELWAQIRDSFTLQVLPGHVAWPDLRDHVPCSTDFSAMIWIRDGGDEVWLLTTLDHWLVARRVAMTTSSVLEIALLRTPEPLEWQAHQEHNGQLWVFGKTHVLRLAADPWEVLDWIPYARFAEPGEACIDAVVSAGAGRLWCLFERGDRHVARAYGLDAWRLEEVHHGILKISALPCAQDGAMVMHTDDDYVLFHRHAPGRKVWTRTQFPGIKTAGLCAGGQHFVMIGRQDLGPEPEDKPVRLLFVERKKGDMSFLALPGTDPNGLFSLAVDENRRLVYAATTSYAGHETLRAASLSALGPAQHYDLVVPRASHVLNHARSQCAALLCQTFAGTRVIPLGAEAPEIRPQELLAPRGFPSMEPLTQPCVAAVVPAVWQAVEGLLAGALSIEQQDTPAAWVAAVWEQVGGDQQHLAAVLMQLRAKEEAQPHGDLLEARCRAHFQPLSPLMAVACALNASRSARWQDMIDCLQAAPFSAMDPALAGDALFQLGIAELRLGHPERAVERWKKAQLAKPLMPLYIVHAQVLAAGPEGNVEIPDEPELGGAVHFQRALHADALIAQGRWQETIDLLDCVQSWPIWDPQYFARLCLCALNLSLQDDTQQYRVFIFLALFLYLRRGGAHMVNEPFYGPYIWSEDRLADLEQRAEQALAGLFAVEPT